MRKTMIALALSMLTMGIYGCAPLFQYADNPVDMQKTIFVKKNVHVYGRRGPGQFVPKRKTDKMELHQYIALEDDWYGLWTPKGEPLEWVPRSSAMTPEEKEAAEKEEKAKENLALEKKKQNEEIKKKEREQELKKHGYIIERVWVDSQIDTGYALVTYQNFSRETYRRVSIECVGISNGDQRIGVNSRSFMDLTDGPIYPGFIGTQEIPIYLHGAELKSISCKCVGHK